MTSTNTANSRQLLIISAAALFVFGPCVDAIVEYAAYSAIECDDVTLHSYSGIATPEACQVRCDMESLCRAFSFSLSNRECYLKKDCSEPRKQDGFVSAVDKTIVASTESSYQLTMSSPTRSNELIVDEAGDAPEDATSTSSDGRIVVTSTWTFPSLDVNVFGRDNYTRIFQSSIQTGLASAAGVLDEQVSVDLLQPNTFTQARVEVRFPSERDVASFAVQLVSAPSSLLSASTLQSYGPASVTNVAVTLDLLGDLPAPSTPAPAIPTTPIEPRPTPAISISPTPSPTAATSQAPSTAPTPAPTPGPTETSPTTFSSTTSPTATPTSRPTASPAAAAPTPANAAETIEMAPLTSTPVSKVDEGAQANDNQQIATSETMSSSPDLLAAQQVATPPPPGHNEDYLEPSSPKDSELPSSELYALGIFGGAALLIILTFGAIYYVVRKREKERSLVKEVTFDDGISAIEDKDIEGRGDGAQAALQQLGATSDSSMWGVRVLGNIRSSMDGSIASSSLSGTLHGMLSRPGAAPAWGREGSRRQSLAGTATGSELAESHCDEAESSRLLPPRWWGGPSPWWVSDSDSRAEHPLGV